MEYPQNLTVSERRWFDLIQKYRTSGKSDAQWMRNDVQEVVPLFLDDVHSIMTNNNPSASSSITDNTIAVRLSIQGISVEIANGVTPSRHRNNQCSESTKEGWERESYVNRWNHTYAVI